MRQDKARKRIPNLSLLFPTLFSLLLFFALFLQPSTLSALFLPHSLSLLNIFSGRVTNGVSGTVVINGQPGDISDHKRRIAYVLQDGTKKQEKSEGREAITHLTLVTLLCRFTSFEFDSSSEFELHRSAPIATRVFRRREIRPSKKNTIEKEKRLFSFPYCFFLKTN
jgi:hypothetical protein